MEAVIKDANAPPIIAIKTFQCNFKLNIEEINKILIYIVK